MDDNLRETFDTQADLYSVARPRYPKELFDALVEETNLDSNSHILEIGPGTGQATKPLAELGCNITAVELGAELAAVWKNELKQFPNANIIVGEFETVTLPANSFDMVLAATSFHWIKQKVRFTKPYELLKEGGNMVIIGTNHVSDEQGDDFFQASQPLYDKYSSDGKSKAKLPRIDELKTHELDTNLFRLVFFERYQISTTYTADEYAQLLNTFSSTISMEPSRKEAFLTEIRQLINEQFEGKTTKHVAMTLTIGKKL